MRTPADSDFFVDVEGVGRFRFARRTFGDRIAIRREHVMLTQGLDLMDAQLTYLALMMSTLKVLTVDAPKGWEDIEALDFAADPEVTEDLVFKVYDALRAHEDSFRKGNDKASEGAGQGDGQDDGVLVPAEVPAAAKRSTVPGADA